jgi:hypothetical protein
VCQRVCLRAEAQPRGEVKVLGALEAEVVIGFWAVGGVIVRSR